MDRTGRTRNDDHSAGGAFLDCIQKFPLLMTCRSLLLLLTIAGTVIGAFGSSVQEQAAFLAGMPLPKGSTLTPLQNSPDYRQHQKELQEQWAFCRRIRYHVNARDANLILATRIDVRPDSVALPSVITPMPLLTPTPAPAHTPKPRRIRIRKALPVEIRRALPVNAPPTVPITLSEPSQEIQLPQPTDAPRIEAAPEVMVIPEAAPLR